MRPAHAALPPLNPKERLLVEHINTTWTREDAMRRLKSDLQTAVSVELSTLPLYLYTYYSVGRKVQTQGDGGFPDAAWARWADEAGALIMSVAVEEMLHMSLAGNVLAALGVPPKLYGSAPASFPAQLPNHAANGPDGLPALFHLGPVSYDQIWQFIEIEYPAPADFTPGDGRQDPANPAWTDPKWSSLSQLYGYLRCIVQSKWITDEDFHHGHLLHQIGTTDYSPNNIDTAWPGSTFRFKHSPPPGHPGSASRVARFANREDSHRGPAGHFLEIHSKESALAAFTTICGQGEGVDFSRFDDPSHHENSHYWKFLRVLSALPGYTQAPQRNQNLPPKPGKPPVTFAMHPSELDRVIFAAPSDPSRADLPAGPQAVAAVADGLFQYMLVLSETVYRVKGKEAQKVFFNKALHQSMIWVLDKLVQAMRQVRLDDLSQVYPTPGGAGPRLMPTFTFLDLGARAEAFGRLCALVEACENLNSKAPWYTTDIQGYVQLVAQLPDVSGYWGGQEPAPPPAPPSPSAIQRRFQGAPMFPGHPPPPWALPEGVERHACMGLNACRNQGRTLQNACAAQGYCSTALAYNPGNPRDPRVGDHTCHVKNECRGQGGCGLYGTAEEQSQPGQNACQAQGSCATPINAERFSTDGPNRGRSVWERARQVFYEQRWPALCAAQPNLDPQALPPVPGTPSHPDLFAHGPPMGWIEAYSGATMTACGASGLSGAGSCT